MAAITSSNLACVSFKIGAFLSFLFCPHSMSHPIMVELERHGSNDSFHVAAPDTQAATALEGLSSLAGPVGPPQGGTVQIYDIQSNLAPADGSSKVQNTDSLMDQIVDQNERKIKNAVEDAVTGIGVMENDVKSESDDILDQLNDQFTKENEAEASREEARQHLDHEADAVADKATNLEHDIETDENKLAKDEKKAEESLSTAAQEGKSDLEKAAGASERAMDEKANEVMKKEEKAKESQSRLELKANQDLSQFSDKMETTKMDEKTESRAADGAVVDAKGRINSTVISLDEALDQQKRLECKKRELQAEVDDLSLQKSSLVAWVSSGKAELDRMEQKILTKDHLNRQSGNDTFIPCRKSALPQPCLKGQTPCLKQGLSEET